MIKKSQGYVESETFAQVSHCGERNEEGHINKATPAYDEGVMLQPFLESQILSYGSHLLIV